MVTVCDILDILFYKQDDRFFFIPHDMGLSDRTENRGFNLLIENKNNTYSHIILELENL